MEKAEAYREFERLKRMDEFRMYYYRDGLTFIYIELGARIEQSQGINIEKDGVELITIKIDEPMNREEFENFCKTSHFFKLGDDGVFEKLIVDDSKL